MATPIAGIAFLAARWRIVWQIYGPYAAAQALFEEKIHEKHLRFSASISAGGLGTILFDGLRTMNTAKILWGSLLSAVLAIVIDRLLILVEKKSEKAA